MVQIKMTISDLRKEVETLYAWTEDWIGDLKEGSTTEVCWTDGRKALVTIIGE